MTGSRPVTQFLPGNALQLPGGVAQVCGDAGDAARLRAGDGTTGVTQPVIGTIFAQAAETEIPANIQNGLPAGIEILLL